MEAGRGDSLVGRRVRQFESKSASPGVQRRIQWRQMRLEVLPHKSCFVEDDFPTNVCLNVAKINGPLFSGITAIFPSLVH